MRRITTDVREKIQALCRVLGDFLPLTSRSKSAVTFKSIFAGRRIAGYLEGDIKQKALSKGWEKIIRLHPRLPYLLIRDIVPASINYRYYKRNPLRKEEIDQLMVCLEALDIDMRKELEKLKASLNENIPEITVAPAELIKRLEHHPLSPEIASAPLQLFKDGHFNEAVRKSAERFEARVQLLSNKQEKGRDLMSKAFNVQKPCIQLNNLLTENERNTQEGIQFMAMGMMQAIRNIFSHGDEPSRSPEECYEMLLSINWLFRKLNEAIPFENEEV